MEGRADIAIRSDIRPGDLGYITYLHGTIYGRECGFDTTFEPYVAVPLAEFVAAGDPGSRIWILQGDGPILGCVAIVRLDDVRAQLRWFLLDPSVRGQGYGTALLRLSIAFCRERGYRAIILWTVDFMKAAVALYLRHGFVLAEEKRHALWGRELTEQRYELSLE
ncbi:MAG: GNAT family N-acetyltransferase [Spirochaetes bacterium]|nr:GNAT family N-acetyltransferase [Spirochaetota bacterium]